MRPMRAFALTALALALAGPPTGADELKSGPEKRAGTFHVKAITGENKGKSLCYV